MLDSSYTKALETKGEWARWAKTDGLKVWTQMDEAWLKANSHATEEELKATRRSYASVLPLYTFCLEDSDTFFMNTAFCDLVDHARISVPDELEFNDSWMLARQGWLWMAEPVEVPTVEITREMFKARNKDVPDIKIRAIGWVHIPEGTHIGGSNLERTTAGPGAYEFLCYQSFDDYQSKGFGCWSYFMLQNGDKLGARIKSFEEQALHTKGTYVDSTLDPTAESHHEIRWVYSAFYLMAQRLAVQIEHTPDRSTRKRAERAKISIPSLIKVISLRKLEAARKIALTRNEPMEWHWHWMVRGHWRNQWYAKTQSHKQVFVEAYVKGDPSKPMKPPSQKLFVAVR